MKKWESMGEEALRAEVLRLKAEISTANNNQMARKIMMNSEYGALGNRYFRYFDLRFATAITLSGQFALKWIHNALMNHPLRKKYDWHIAAADTDSLYMSVETLGRALMEKYGGDMTKVANKLDEFALKVIQPIIDKGYGEFA